MSSISGMKHIIASDKINKIVYTINQYNYNAFVQCTSLYQYTSVGCRMHKCAVKRSKHLLVRREEQDVVK